MNNNKLNKITLILSVVFFIGTVYFAGLSYGLFNKTESEILEKSESIKNVSKDDENYYEKTYKKVDIVKDFIKENFYKDTSEIDFEEAMIRGLFKSLDDPYSVYFNKEEYKSFTEMSEGTYGGLGITVTPAKTGYITVLSTFKNTPAEKSGIQNNDKIIKVEGVEYTADQMDIAVSKMKGKPGTDVTLTILRDEKEIELTLTRALIVLESVESKIIDENIAYIRLMSFDNKVYDEFLDHYKKLESQGIKGLVLDLRGNPGGSLYQCILISDFLLGEQVIVSTKDKKGFTTPYNSDANKIEIPFVVLADGGSASASEILVGAVKDGKAAKIIGTKTFGKGVVQSVWPFSGDAGIKLTTSEYFTPSGENIHEKGIKPDIELKLSEDYKPTDEKTDNQLQKALEVLKSEIK